MKSSTVWIIAGVLLMFFLLNHWMSREISQTTTPKPTVEIPLNNVPENQAQPLTIPGVPIDEKIIEPPIKTTKAPKAVEPENQGPSEPIYEPPGNSVILTQ